MIAAPLATPSVAHAAPEGTLGWQAFTGPSWPNHQTVYLPSPWEACQTTAQWAWNANLVYIAEKIDVAYPAYDCFYPHFLSGVVFNWAITQLVCAPGFVYIRTREHGEGSCYKLPATPISCLSSGTTGECNSQFCPVNRNDLAVNDGINRVEIVDFSTGGTNALVIRRIHNSRGQVPKTGLGRGWQLNFDRRLILDFTPNPVNVYVYREDGSWQRYTPSGSNWVAPTDVMAKLARIGTTNQWTFTDENDRVDTFEVPSGSLIGRIISSVTKSGYQQTFAYDTAGKLASITDSYSRSLAFVWDGAVISTITAPGPILLKYNYTRGLIGSTPIPGSEKLASVETSLPDGTQKTTQTLHYENVDYPRALTGITDENGIRVATWAYGSFARVTSSQLAGGAGLTTVSYDDVANTRTVTNPLGKQAIFRFTTLQGKLKLTRIDGQASLNCPAASQVTAYDGNGFISSRQDWKGNTTTYVNNTRGLETSRTEASGTAVARTITTTWHATFRVPTQIVAPGKTTDFVYDSNGRLTSKTETDTTTTTVPYSTNGRTRVWTYTYNASGQVLTVNGPRTDVTDVTTYAYNAAGNLTSVTNALSHVTSITSYNNRALPLTIVDANNVTTNLAYDIRGRLTSRTVVGAGGNAVTGFTYNDRGDVTRITLPNSSYLDYTYDNARRLTRVTNNLGERIDYALDAMGNRTLEEIRDAGATIKKTQSRVFDELGRLLRSIGAGSQTTIHGYDNNGNLISTIDPLTRVTSQGFDALNRLIQVTDPSPGGNTQYGYNNRDDQISVTDPRGLVTAYVYDGLGNRIQTTSPDTGVTVYEYDSAGNRTRQTDARGIVTNYAYDALNRMTGKTFPASSGENVTYVYDEATSSNGKGRLTSVSEPTGSTVYHYDERGNLTQERRTIGGVLYVTSYTHDLSDSLTQIVYPSGRIVDYARDALGRVSGVTTKANAGATAVNVATSLAYLPFGPLSAMTHGNGLAHTRGYDQDYRLTTLRTLGTPNVQDLTYGYDANSNITGITDALTSARSQTLGYDALNRLTSAAGAYGSFSYGYDTVGNRTSQVLTGGSGGFSESYSYAGTSNRLQSVTQGSATRSFSYTAAGNTSLDNRGVGQDFGLVYNNDNRLIEVTQASQSKATYQHNGKGERVAKAIPGAPAVVTHFHFDRSGTLIAESDGAGAVAREYIWLDGMPLAQVAAGAVLFYHPDHLGTPQRITDASAALVWDAVFRPFGQVETLSGTATNNLRFPGQYADSEAGLAYNYFRDYDPSLGRYAQSDPIGLRGGPNTYAYAAQNPVSQIDPKGEFAIGVVVIGIRACLANPACRAAAQAIAAATGRALADVIMSMLSLSSNSDKPCPDCAKILEQCRDDCVELYAGPREKLPGSGHDYFGRMRRCIRECMEANGCAF